MANWLMESDNNQQVESGDHGILGFMGFIGFMGLMGFMRPIVILDFRGFIQGASKKRGPFGFAVTQNISEYQNIRIYPKLLITVFVSLSLIHI